MWITHNAWCLQRTGEGVCQIPWNWSYGWLWAVTWVLGTKPWTLARTGRTILPAPPPPLIRPQFSSHLLGGRHFQVRVLCHVILSEGAAFHMAACKEDERERSRDCEQDQGGGSALESNLGSDIPSLLWNPILQELITRYSPHSREGFAHRQECQKVGRLIRVHCRVGECAGNLSHIPWLVRRLTGLNL